ncbi:MAG: DUF2807 domain-containing protein [Reichenbachiella sp.]
MKKLISIIGITLATIIVVTAQNKETRALGSFDEIKVGQSIRLTIIPGEKNEAIVETTGVDVERVETEISGDLLKIGMARGSYNSTTVNVTLTFKELSGVKVSSSARLNGKGVIKADDFYADVSSSGRASLEVSVNKLKVEVSSSGRLELSGTANTQVVDVSSSGRYSAFGVQSDGVKADVSSSGRVEVSVAKEIYADASSSGRISYRGNPEKVIADTSSSGKVSKE